MNTRNQNEIGTELTRNARAADGERVQQRAVGTHPILPALPNGKFSSPSAQNRNGGRSAAMGQATVAADARNRLIARSAYFIAEQRRFIGGDPVADWLQAEREIDRET